MIDTISFVGKKIVINNNVDIKVEMTRGYVNGIRYLEFSQKTHKYLSQNGTDK